MKFVPVVTSIMCFGALCSAHAAEGYMVRYNLAGSLGGEMFAPPDQSGWGAGMAATTVKISKITGSDGKALRTSTPSGTVSVPGLPAAYNPSYSSNEVEVEGSGRYNIYNVALGYISEERFGNGRLAWLVNVPYGVKDQRLAGRTTAPALNWPSNALPSSATKSAVQQQFNSTYMNQVNADAAAETDKIDGLGDVELQAGWLYTTEQWRVLSGASVVLPTGRYQSTAGPDIGAGNFYTFRPSVQVAWLPRTDLSVATKLTMGFNTRNADNDLRSGNWAGLETALAYLTPVGPIGVHSVLVRQVQDDSGNPIGAARFMSSNVGMFFTTKIPGLGAVITAQTMRALDSHYAKHGTIQQIRLIKLF